jgi:periplasmic divalent cation tolerance protein
LTDKIVVLVTCSKRRECLKIARRLVNKRLAACVNVTSPIQSVYRWEGKVSTDKEFLLLIKSVRQLFPQITAEISKLHSYQTPEMICLPIVDGSPDYLQWLQTSLEMPGTPEAHPPTPAA